jgi:transcriptional activator SPT8
VYIGRRNNTVDVYDAAGPFKRTLQLPRNSGLVSKVACLENGRTLLIGSTDNIRLWDLEHQGKGVPFNIIPGNNGSNASEIGRCPKIQLFAIYHMPSNFSDADRHAVTFTIQCLIKMPDS